MITYQSRPVLTGSSCLREALGKDAQCPAASFESTDHGIAVNALRGARNNRDALLGAMLANPSREIPVLVREMLEAGAHGFVEKTAGLFEFKKGLETVANGGTYFGPAVAALLRDVVANPGSSNSADFLTDREREILQLVAESHSTKEIAAKLNISVKTVDNHRTNLMRKLNLHDVASLTRYAVEVGLIEPRKPL